MNIHISGFSDEISSDFETQLKTVRALGMRYISLRSAWGKNICDFTPEEVRERLLPLLRKYEVGVSSLGSILGKTFIDDTEAAAKAIGKASQIAEICRLVNCRYVRMFSFYIPKGDSAAKWRPRVLENLRQIVEIFEAAGITAIHENEKNLYGDTAERCLDLMRSLDSPAFRCAFDFANFVQVGESALEAYELLREYIVYFHIKDARRGYGDNVLCGTGDGQIARILKQAICSDGYEGFLTLEPHLVLFDTLQMLELDDAKDIIKENRASDGKEAYGMQYAALRRILEGF